MTEYKSNPIVDSTPLTEEDEFYLDWGQETVKNNISLVNDVLKQCVSINGLLLGGSILFIEQTRIDGSVRVVIVLCFVASLASAFFGVLPFKGNVILERPSEIKLHKAAALSHKMKWLLASAALLIIGLSVGFGDNFWDRLRSLSS
jgi:ribose/xylose/arabinose/galactoside ABC-type transport system permease subunit